MNFFADNFIIDSYTGTIATKQILDYEYQNQYSLRVLAEEEASYTGSPITGAHIISTYVSVIIVDQNDHAPVFDKKMYEATVDEMSKPKLLLPVCELLVFHLYVNIYILKDLRSNFF